MVFNHKNINLISNILYLIALILLPFSIIFFIFWFYKIDLYFFNIIEKHITLFSAFFTIFIVSYIYIIMFNTIVYIKNHKFKFWLTFINIVGNLLFGFFIFLSFKYHFEKFYKNPSTEFNLIGHLFKEIPLQYKIQISKRLDFLNMFKNFNEFDFQKSKPYDINYIEPDNVVFELTRLNIFIIYEETGNNFKLNNLPNLNLKENYYFFFLILVCFFLPHIYKDYILYNECLKNYNYNYLKRFLDPNLNFYNETDLINLVIDKSNQNKENKFPYELSHLYEPNKDALFFTEYLDIIYPKNISITFLVDLTILFFTVYIFIIISQQWEYYLKKTLINKVFLNIFKLILFVIIFFCLNALLLTPFSYYNQSVVIFTYILACLLYIILGFLWLMYLYLLYLHFSLIFKKLK